MIHAILGTGPCPEKALTEALRDALGEGDEIVVPWVWPIPPSLESVYAFILDHEIPFMLVYSDDAGKVPTRHFRDAEFGTVLKSRDPIERCINECSNSVLYLWDDDYDLVEKILDGYPHIQMRELSNGLAPIVIDEQGTVPAPETQDDSDQAFSKEELEVMSANAVKRYGENRGCVATTKSGIIEELFSELEDVKPVMTIVLYDDGTWKQLND